MSSLNDFHFLRPLWLITIPIFYWLIFSSYNNFLKIGNWENLIDQKFLIFLSTKPKNNRKDPIPWLISFTITLKQNINMHKIKKLI